MRKMSNISGRQDIKREQKMIENDLEAILKKVKLLELENEDAK